MAEKTPYSKPLSENAIGLPNLETAKIDINGVFENCIILSFTVNYNGKHSTFDIKYRKKYADNKGNKLDVQTYTKTATVKDIAEIGLVEYDPDGNPKMETYEKTADENNELTRWFLLLGDQINPALIYFINQSEGYPQPAPE